MADRIEFWFDPTCPFTWRTSRWVAGVAERKGATVSWRMMSLAILNQDKEIPEQWRELMAKGRTAGKVFQAVSQDHGGDALARFYTEVGSRLHEQGGALGPDLLRESLAAAGLPEDLAAAGDDDSYLPGLAESHAAGQARVGQESGSPITAVGDGPGFFGPVVVPVPSGHDAVKLFDAITLLSQVPAFSELKRARAAF